MHPMMGFKPIVWYILYIVYYDIITVTWNVEVMSLLVFTCFTCIFELSNIKGNNSKLY